MSGLRSATHLYKPVAPRESLKRTGKFVDSLTTQVRLFHCAEIWHSVHYRSTMLTLDMLDLL